MAGWCRHREQAERELARLRFGEAAGLLDLMNRAGPVIAGQEAVVMDALSFRDASLSSCCAPRTSSALEALVTRLKALDLSAEVQSASMDADGASGRVAPEPGSRIMSRAGSTGHAGKTAGFCLLAAVVLVGALLYRAGLGTTGGFPRAGA